MTDTEGTGVCKLWGWKHKVRNEKNSFGFSVARNWALGFTQQGHILARPMAATDIEDKLFSDMIKSNEIRKYLQWELKQPSLA